MRAGDPAEPYPTVCTDDDAVDAARLSVERRLPALLVLDRDGRPYAIVGERTRTAGAISAARLMEHFLDQP
ncbi:CBS domain-containing protein [Streptomyces halobius]|uniref:CBS domain-containing protein n=1 Tax=Streptomyces halobius TaxID=2879846 RepID=A0ABY4M4H2_9ACTN|nr:hypothetical protein [Streptomyces halobius]UQA92362.1 hypothetical protein K9S39_11395 [Streptomyces halobius]